MISLVSGVISSGGGSSGLLLAQSAPSGGNNMFGLSGMLPILLMIVIFYMIIFRPQQKRQRELQEWLKSLKKGDEVVTTGGLYGKISGEPSPSSPYVTLELQEKVRIRVLRSHIAGKAPSNDAAGVAAATTNR